VECESNFYYALIHASVSNGVTVSKTTLRLFPSGQKNLDMVRDCEEDAVEQFAVIL
jgi:hypothetical protein